jgi:membrane fusion protein, copper/silver efflux system
MKMMKLRSGIVITALFVAVVSFLAGSWATYQGFGNKAKQERRILHYVDPMNPALTSDKPGIAPCGMPLEPVYADQAGGGPVSLASMPPGTIRITPEKQQLIGVRTVTVEKAPWSHTLRVLGRVTPDETCVYRINAAVNGWITETLPVTTGSMVKKNGLLAKFYSLEYRTVFQNYFNLINISKQGNPGVKAEGSTSKYSVAQLRQMREAAKNAGQSGDQSQINYYRNSILSYGMSAYQLEEMERTRTIPEDIDIRSPIAGFILFRNVSPGLRFDRGAEFYRIADLSKVWILADIFENEAGLFKPGMRVKMELPYRKKTLFAQVSPVLPLFDAATRTLKVRLVADNPGYVMRPDMFVNVELPLNGPPAMIVPADAVLDSGLKKTVFVDRGNGYFEPRPVETGRTLGDRVEVVRGLMPGEKIVVAGNFLIDSEARMQQSASGINGKPGRDLVCGMNIDEDRARADGYLRDYQGKTYFFCSPECRDEFGKAPERYLKAAPAQENMPMPDAQGVPKAKSAARKAAAKQGAHDHEAMLKSQGAAPMPMTHDHGAMMTPDTKDAAPPPARAGRSGRGARGRNTGSQPMPMTPDNEAPTMRGNMPASPAMDFKPAPAPPMSGNNMPMPGATMQQAPGLQGPAPMPGPGGPGGSSFPGAGGSGGPATMPGPGGPASAPGAKNGKRVSPANGTPARQLTGPGDGMSMPTPGGPGLNGLGPGAGMPQPGSPPQQF